MDIRSQSSSGRRQRQRRGATAVQMLVILVPVVFGLMGFAVDLGRIYMIRGELKAAATSMALAAAGQLIGTEPALEQAAEAARLAGAEAAGFSNRYDYGGRILGESTGNLTSEVAEPVFFETVEAATGSGESGDNEAGSGATARHVRVVVTADAPLVFWSFLPLAQERKTPVRVQAVAGLSAPLCTACGIESIAIAALDPGDEEHFGLIPATRYTLGYVCNGPGAPGPLPGTIQRLPYLLVNRLNEEAELFPDDSTQVFRIGAGGLPASTSEVRSCLAVNVTEQVWATAMPLTCNMNRVAAQVTSFLCGLATRFETGVAGGCANIPEVETAAAPFPADIDVADIEDYSAYEGNRRRIITIAIVDSLGDPQAMTVLGFRQFLLQPIPNSSNVNPVDNNGRFIALYLGSPMPLRQGRFSGCSIAYGPGKVVLHQ